MSDDAPSFRVPERRYEDSAPHEAARRSDEDTLVVSKALVFKVLLGTIMGLVTALASVGAYVLKNKTEEMGRLINKVENLAETQAANSEALNGLTDGIKPLVGKLDDLVEKMGPMQERIVALEVEAKLNRRTVPAVSAGVPQ